VSASSKIEWTDASWNPIRAIRQFENAPGMDPETRIGWHCEKVSEACMNCYAESMNKRLGTGLAYKPENRRRVEIFLDEKVLIQPLKWRKPRKIFVCSMTDLFGEWVPDEWLDSIFAVMALCPHHTFQVLMKRPKRMREYVTTSRRHAVAASATMIADTNPTIFKARALVLSAVVEIATLGDPLEDRWPLPNVWLGVTAENQVAANERIPHVLATPAAVRWVSYEPALGPINLTSIDPTGHQRSIGASGWSAVWKDNNIGRAWLDWIVCGDESGHKARESNLEWHRSVRDQCAAAGVAFYEKQITHRGKKVPFEVWPADLKIRQFPEVKP
jgi:protein gp37